MPVKVNTENVTAVGKDPNPGKILLWCTQSAECVPLPSPISTTPRLVLGPTQPPVRWVEFFTWGNYISTSWRRMGQFYCHLSPFSEEEVTAVRVS